MISLTDLLSIPTKEEFIDKFTGLFRLAGIPVASWQTTSFLRQTVESEASLLVDIVTLIQKVAKGGFIKLAVDVSDDWVDLCAENVFSEARKPAIYTRGMATITDTESIGPITIQPGTFWIANAAKTLRFQNADAAPVVVPLGGSASLTFQADTAGTAWNVGNGELTEILTPQPGLEVVNEPLDTGTWITQQGADRETSALLAQRCLDKWSTLGAGSDAPAYRYRATSSSSEITRCEPYSPGAGSVRVPIAGDAGPVSATALEAAAAIIEQKRPIGVPDVLTYNAIVFSQSIAGTLYVKLGRDPAAVLSAAQASLNAFQRALSIGAKVSREKVIQALLVDGVDDLELTVPLTDVQLARDEVWIPTYSLVTA